MNSFSLRVGALAVLALTIGHAPAAEPIELVPPGFLKRDPCATPDGKGIVFAEAVSSANAQLRMVDLADKSVTLFQKSGREVTFSSDGKVIAHTSGDGLGCNVEIADKRRDRKIGIRGGFISGAALSPDGRYVVVVAEFGLLHLVDLDSIDAKDAKKGTVQVELKKDPKGNALEIPGVKRLTPAGVHGDYAPHFSSDGKTIVFASRRDNDFEIYAMSPDGENIRRLTNSPGIDNQPVFSPDGKQIAFTSNRDLNYEIYIMNADGTNVRRVTNHPERDDFPCWTTDGRSIVFVGERNGKFGLYQVAVP